MSTEPAEGNGEAPEPGDGDEGELVGPVEEVYFEDDPTEPGPAASEASIPFDPEPHRESMRGRLAAGLVALLALLIVGGL